jgi:L-asparaginase II
MQATAAARTVVEAANGRMVRPDPGVPLLEEVRNGRTQAVHTGHAVLLDRDGKAIRSWGDPKTGAYWRSSLKPIQVEPLLATGAAERFGIGPDLVALACASHSSEPRHVIGAKAILAAAGLSETDLQCGPHEPYGGRLSGAEPPTGWTPIHSNCSGKHAAMLAACVHNGWPTEGYLDPEGPLQRRIRALVGELTGEPVAWGVDGCSAPTFWSSLEGMARAYQRHNRTAVGRRAFDAMLADPFMVAGTARFCTAFLEAGRGAFVGKVGAAGLYVALHRETGQAFAVKLAAGVRDVVEQAAALLADAVGWLDDEARKPLDPWLDHRLVNCRLVDVGGVRSWF